MGVSGNRAPTQNNLGGTAAVHIRHQLADMYRAMLESMLEDYKDRFTTGLLTHDRRLNSPKWSTVVLGGGANYAEVRTAIADLSLPSASGQGYRVAPIGAAPRRFAIRTYSHVVFIRQQGGTVRTRPLAGLRTSWPHYFAALERPSSILQLALGLASGAFHIPAWSAGEPVPATNRPRMDPDEAWRDFHPWAEH